MRKYLRPHTDSTVASTEHDMERCHGEIKCNERIAHHVVLHALSPVQQQERPDEKVDQKIGSEVRGVAQRRADTRTS